MLINNKEVEYEKIQRFKEAGIYEIKLKFKIYLKDAKYMFREYPNIIDIDLSEFETKNVTNMERMFEILYNLKN